MEGIIRMIYQEDKSLWVGMATGIQGEYLNLKTYELEFVQNTEVDEEILADISRHLKKIIQ